MGGICGFIGAGEQSTGKEKEAMLRALSHRGDVVWLDWASAGSVAIDSSFNAADATGSVWTTWMDDPEAFPARLEGSFAVAAIDRRRGRLLLARDAFGEKPLYYVATREGVAFASEIKALRAAAALRDLTLSPEAIDAYLAFTYVPAPRTIFAGALKVPGGHCVVFSLRDLAEDPGGAARTARWWRLPDRVGESAPAAQMARMLAEALERRLGDAPAAAAFLSGGLDSSVALALASREEGRRFDSYAVAFREADLDESAHARRVAGLLGARHHEILLDEIDPDVACRVIDQLDEPMADAACIPTFLLARAAARDGSRVALTGDGADALLAGDHWFRRLQRLDAWEGLPSPLRAALPFAAALGGPRRYRRCRDQVALVELGPAARYLRIREKWSEAERAAIFTAGFRERLDPSAAASTYLNAAVEWRPRDSVDAAIRLDTIHSLPEGLLMKADKMGMAHGVESRSPFMDRRFAEWAARLETGLLLNGRVSKYLLKKAAETLLPAGLVHRRKHGFQVPVGRWLKGSLRDLTEQAFDAALIRRQGIFDAEALGRLKRRFDRGATTPALDGRVWQIVALQTWWRRVFEV